VPAPKARARARLSRLSAVTLCTEKTKREKESETGCLCWELAIENLSPLMSSAKQRPILSDMPSSWVLLYFRHGNRTMTCRRLDYAQYASNYNFSNYLEIEGGKNIMCLKSISRFSFSNSHLESAWYRIRKFRVNFSLIKFIIVNHKNIRITNISCWMIKIKYSNDL